MLHLPVSHGCLQTITIGRVQIAGIAQIRMSERIANQSGSQTKFCYYQGYVFWYNRFEKVYRGFDDSKNPISQTLDALPSHLVTPFNGPIPPSNLLDKIARGVANAKGPAEWPHSLRATRVKLIEIARQRAKEDPPRGPKSVVTDENDDISCYSTDSDMNAGLSRKRSRVIPRRPLYRQSSMDFVNPGDRKNGDNITRFVHHLPFW